jgi:hypothetical protein
MTERRWTAKWLRRSYWVVGLVLVSTASFIFLAFVHHRYKARRARRLVSAIAGLRLGESGVNEVQRVVSAYRSDLVSSETQCSGPDCAFTIQMDTAFWKPLIGHEAWLDTLAYHFASLTENGVLGRLGMRNFVVTASMRTTNGVLESSTASVIVAGDCQKWLGGSWRLLREMPTFSKTKVPVAASPSDHLVIRWIHLHMGLETGEALDASVTPDATPEEKAAAFGINMNCLTSRSGCFFLGDLMPRAVQLQKLRSHWPMGGTSQACSKHTDPD